MACYREHHNSSDELTIGDITTVLMGTHGGKFVGAIRKSDAQLLMTHGTLREVTIRRILMGRTEGAVTDGNSWGLFGGMMGTHGIHGKLQSQYHLIHQSQ